MTRSEERVQGTRAKALKRYPLNIVQAIPLHMPKDRMTRHGRTVEVGKVPVHANWTTRPYDSKKVIAAALDSGRNVGIRLTDEQLVVDIDPRNGGKEGWAKLCHDIGIDDSTFPKVITGSGGWHLYMSKPADVLIRDTLESDDYNGVEFKSKGRQVVAAGSIHPNGKAYRWANDAPDIRNGLPPCPRPLLKAITRPARGAVAGGGQISPEELAAMLSNLNAEDFAEHGKWLQVMMAAHHGTAGDGRAEFIDWSTSDPAYAKDAFIIGKRWDSLHAERNDGVTYRTLNKFLREAGHADAQAAPSCDDVTDDFDDAAEDESWLEGGGLFEDWLEGKKSKPVLHELGGLLYQNAAEVEAERINWLWPDRLASGKINFVAGYPDQGKSQITCDK